jgi:hypothetical protein
MKEEVYVCIVRGYHKESQIPATALNHNFMYRFAVVFDTMSQKASSPHFPSVFFTELLGELSLECGYTNLRIETETKTMQISADILRTASSPEFSMLAAEENPPLHIAFSDKCGLACIMESEMWVRVGGAPPYADSYTVSFYTPSDMYERFSDVCIKHCKEKQATILEQIEASDVPVITPWWKRIFI